MTTLDGLPEPTRAPVGRGAGGHRRQPVRLLHAGHRDAAGRPGPGGRSARLGGPTEEVDQALLAHLCRCTGWQTIVEAARPRPRRWAGDDRREHRVDRDLGPAARPCRASRAGAPAGRARPWCSDDAGFADDGRPADALVAVPDGRAATRWPDRCREARALAGKVQGRSTGLSLSHPVAVPPRPVGPRAGRPPGWSRPTSSRTHRGACPGGTPASPVGNGGAFGGQAALAGGRRRPSAGRRARATGRGSSGRARTWSALGPKRPPVAGGIGADGTGVLRVGIPGDGLRRRPPGPRWWPHGGLGGSRSGARAGARGRAAGLPRPACRGVGRGRRAGGRRAPTAAPPGDPGAHRRPGGGDRTRAAAGRSPAAGPTARSRWRWTPGRARRGRAPLLLPSAPAHQALGWVRSEGIAVDADGSVQDLTIRSFGILQARAMPRVTVP